MTLAPRVLCLGRTEVGAAQLSSRRKLPLGNEMRFGARGDMEPVVAVTWPGGERLSGSGDMACW